MTHEGFLLHANSYTCKEHDACTHTHNSTMWKDECNTDRHGNRFSRGPIRLEGEKR